RRGRGDAGVQLLATLPRPAGEAPGKVRVRRGQWLVHGGFLQTVGQDHLQGVVGLVQLEQDLHGGFPCSPPTGGKLRVSSRRSHRAHASSSASERPKGTPSRSDWLTNSVVRVPSAKAVVPRSQRWNAILVVTPSIQHSSSARTSRARASERSAPQAMILATRES